MDNGEERSWGSGMPSGRGASPKRGGADLDDEEELGGGGASPTQGGAGPGPQMPWVDARMTP